MRSLQKKYPYSIGKLTQKKIDSDILCFHSSQGQYHPNSSAILPDISVDNRLQPHQSLSQLPTKSRKPSFICQLQDQSQKPLPQIRVSLSKIHQLRNVCRKNPQEETNHYNGLFPHRYSHKNHLRFKQHHKIGHFYSPRAKSKPQPGFICHQKGRKSRVGILGCLSSPLAIKNKRSMSRLYEYEREKVKIIDENRAYPLNESTEIPLSENRQQVRSRVIPVEPLCHSETSSLTQSIQYFLKDQDQEGYILTPGKEDQREQSKALKNIWEQNYVESNNDQDIKNSFFLENPISVEQNVLKVNFDISFSQLKILLIQEQNKFSATFEFPTVLLNTISESISQPQVHQYAQTIFKYILTTISPQIISFKRFNNCILVTVKTPKIYQSHCKAERLAILWHYTGRFYVGGWSNDIGSQNEGSKSGMGLEYYPLNYVYYGSYSQNARNGFGVMKKASKQIYLGEWKHDRRNDWGKVFSSTGQIILDGNFENGTYISDRVQKR